MKASLKSALAVTGLLALAAVPFAVRASDPGGGD